MKEWWESVLRNGGAIGDSVLRLTGVNFRSANLRSRTTRLFLLKIARLCTFVDLVYFPGKNESFDYSEDATGNFIPSISAEKTEETLYDLVNSDFKRSISPRELSLRKSCFHFWRRTNRKSFKAA